MRIKLRNVKNIYISGENIRLDALLKFSSLASSGGEAKLLIQSNQVYVGGKPCAMRGKKIYPGDVVRFGQQTLVIRST
jgi:ribosome-associated protein